MSAAQHTPNSGIFRGTAEQAFAAIEVRRRLYLAAPQMLEALRAEEEWRAREAAGALDPEWDYETMVGAKRRAAIAKAEGSASC